MDLASNAKMSDQCTRDEFICFRIMKDLDIEPESTADVHSEANFLDQKLARQCVCGCGDDLNQTMTEDEESDEFLSAFEEGSGGRNSSSASSFAFPVLDARWSGSPVKMPPKRKSHDNRKLRLLRKPKRAARIVCRWCRSF